MRKVVVIGAGLGGMAAAAVLARHGAAVTVLESNAAPGGKMGTLERDGYRWDTGPSLLTMPHVLEDLWAACGREVQDVLDFVRLETTCRYRWRDGTVIDEDEAFWARPEVARFLRYAAGIFEVSEEAFLKNPLGRWWRQLLAPGQLAKLRHLPKVASPRTLASVVDGAFDDPHLRQIFLRFATYNGSSPYRTPAAFSIIPFVQARFGGWYIRGGMGRIAEALAALVEDLGAEIRYGEPAEKITRTSRGYRVNGLDCDTVVCNQDVLTASQGLVARLAPRLAARVARQVARHDLSTSGFAVMAAVGRTSPSLLHHNVFFSDDYPDEFDDLFGRRRQAGTPTVYLAASCKSDPERAPEGGENWFVLANAPATEGSTVAWDELRERYADLVFHRLEDGFGLAGAAGRAVRFREILTPADFRRNHHSFGGALYGFASHGASASFRRPPMAPRELPGFYFVGGSTHPGGGIPLVLLGGQMAARAILQK